MLVDEKFFKCELCPDYDKCKAKGLAYSADDINQFESAVLRSLSKIRLEDLPDDVV